MRRVEVEFKLYLDDKQFSKIDNIRKQAYGNQCTTAEFIIYCFKYGGTGHMFHSADILARDARRQTNELSHGK